MNFLELLKGSGLAVLVICLSFYICGWQYYLGFFHRLGVDVHFAIPPESAVGQGMQPIITFITVPILSCAIGLLAIRCKSRYTWASNKTYIASAGGLLIGSILPMIIKLTNTEWLEIKPNR